MATLKYPSDINGSSDYMKFEFFKYAAPYSSGSSALDGSAGGAGYNTSAGGGALKLTPIGGNNIICITMPNDIGSVFSGNWGGKDLTGLAAAAFGGIGAAADLAGFGKKIKENTNDPTKVVKAAGFGLAQDILTAITNSLTTAPGLGSNLLTNDALGLVSGYVINPNTELLYEGTSLRTHGYSFKMIAQSKEEAREILEIAEAFKKSVLPSGDSAKFAGADVRNFIAIPNVCRISFMKGGTTAENEFLPRYKVSAITNVNTSYITENQYTTYIDSEPIGVSLTLAFKELKLIFSEEIGSGPTQFR